MKQQLNKLFGRKAENPSWNQIIGWWELRRVAFNIILLCCGILSILIMALVVRGAGDFISPLAMIGFAFFANLFYTGGWIAELLVKMGKHNTNVWGTRSFKIGLIFAICCTFLPPVIFSIRGISSGEMVSSPYSHFATDKPIFNELVGSYQLDIQKADYISKKDITKHPEMTLRADSTFIVVNFPIFSTFDNYELCNGEGKWQIGKHSSFNTWTISVLYDTLNEVDTKRGKGKLGTEYFIYNNKPPYKIYDIASDPDEWTGVLYRKK
jgi:hypothetical protein